MRRWLALAAWCIAVAAPAQERVLDDFSDPAAWSLQVSDDVHATLQRAADGPGLCVDYDFGHVLGYVALRRPLALEFTQGAQFELGVRGSGGVHDLQVKLTDASGDNVWWLNRPQFDYTEPWQTLAWSQRQIEFAWGPRSDHRLTRTEWVEVVVAAGAAGGKGQACFDRLVMSSRPEAAPAPAAPTRTRGDGVLTLDWGQPREFDALRLQWRPDAAATAYAIEFSDDTQHWTRVREVTQAWAPGQPAWLPHSRTRAVRVRFDAAGQPRAQLLDLEPIVVDGANAYFERLAAHAPRGHYPRAYTGEQSYWTVLGVDGARGAALLGEDGALEPRPAVGALEPFLVQGERVCSWADAHSAHRLHDADLPMPELQWRCAGWTLEIEAFGAGEPDTAHALVRYTVHNPSARPRAVTLALAWRPFQVNPPTQFLAHPGGVSPVHELVWDGRALAVNGAVVLQTAHPPDEVRLVPLAAGPVTQWLHRAPAGVARTRLVDPAGYASAALLYRMALKPHERRAVVVALPLAGASAPLAWNDAGDADDADAAQALAAAHWHDRLDRVSITGAGPVGRIMRSVRAALGQILVERDGAALQPGARAYARSWIRDGALMSGALLRLGCDDVVRDFVRWYAPLQFSSGKVPCCATAAGADPVAENDSDGEFAHAVWQLWDYTHDAATARALWPAVRAAVGHMERLRQSERTAVNQTPERQAYFGLMPPSISHEGYSDKPAYSYWDDFWSATGYRSAGALARALGEDDDAQQLARQGASFQEELLASLQRSMRQHHLDVLPGSADRGDVDPASSTVALSPAGLQGVVPPGVLERTFERYWADFRARRDGTRPWQAYTPYEWRAVGALVRLGQRRRAWDVMGWLYRDQRPPGWLEWAEVVGRNARQPRFIGDMPHGWVASDQIRSALDLFAYEDEGRRSLVLGAGLAPAWLAGDGVWVRGLRTPYGELQWHASMRTRRGRRHVAFELAPLRDAPPGGIVLRGPWPAGARVRVDGQRVVGDAAERGDDEHGLARAARAHDLHRRTRPPTWAAAARSGAPPPLSGPHRTHRGPHHEHTPHRAARRRPGP